MTALVPIGSWKGPAAAFDAAALVSAAARVRETAHVVREAEAGRLGVAFGGQVSPGPPSNGHVPLLATLPALFPEWLGDRAFLEAHGVRFPYVAGEMANGIATADLVIAMARGEMLGFFGAAGLSAERVEGELAKIEEALGGARLPWGVNLIHSPNEPALEDALVDMYLRRGAQRVCASAYMRLTPAVVRFAVSGLDVDGEGRLIRRHHLFAKVSRPEVAQRFLSPAPAAMLAALRSQGRITARQAELAARAPLAEDLTVESDSGGHTDNRPLTALFPTMLATRDALMREHAYARPIRVGAAGGLGTPSAIAAAFALGAAYVLTGTINQAAVESGLSDDGKRLLADADIADVMMAPAADMFEMGVKVQVLRRGTLFGPRAQRLYEVYRGYDSLESLPADVREKLEREIFRSALESVWDDTRRFFESRDPAQNERAARDPKHRMALVFRWYLGKSSRWAIEGDEGRRADYQIWCGPAMGAFNAWTAGSFLAEAGNRSAIQIARNLLEGAAVVSRAQQLRCYGVAIPAAAFDYRPRPLE